MKRIMVQGTASSAGKSLTVAALCRIFTQDGYRVCPFKSQNMSLNSYVDEEGLEMGRAQVLQAYACRIKPRAFMNPILLKPTTDRKSQVIIMGRPYKNMDAVEYFEFKDSLKDKIREIYKDIEKNFDIVVIEGAGSPAEINLKDNDIVNMGMAEIADSNVLLVADIDRGGVFASIYGTYMLLEEEEKKRIKGVIINKFRGDKSLLKSGIEKIESLIKVPVVGVVPYIDLKLEDEDGASDIRTTTKGEIKISVIRLPRISNFTDFNAFLLDEDVSLSYAQDAEDLKDADIIIIPGSKNTIEDLRWLKQRGFFDAVKNHKGIVFGICGGYQMMGREIIDEEGWETYRGDKEDGLSFFEGVTYLKGNKRTKAVIGSALGSKIEGYEIHMGETLNSQKPFVEILEDEQTKLDGDMVEGKYYGTYVHGIFDSGEFREKILNMVRNKKGLENKISEDFDKKREEELDKLAAVFRDNVDIEYIYKIMQ
ncbi:Cobyric acid synthase [Caloramator mitchellensis]|uniref:Cobyric acid synthase n=1 Tax=Caloramator mitchellensis TaxID=908809 RepID=A0A0R3JZB8_CALMK|nr:cobyric acid synthase [Caloramator mitchellensis]KRQ85925.1 Cobyric acid synthase [Caloramator mitchellensis]